MVGKEQQAKSSLLIQKFRKSPMPGLATCKDMELAQSDIRILLSKSPIQGSPGVHGFQDESPEKLDPVEQGLEDTTAMEGAAEKPGRGPSGPGGGASLDRELPVDTPAGAAGVGPTLAAMTTGLAVNGKGTSPFMDALMANGMTSVQMSATGVRAGKRKFIEDR